MSEVAEALIVAADLRKDYGAAESAVHALRGIDLEVRRGEYWAVMGPSGSGKSTLLHLLGLLHRPSDGRLQVFGRDQRIMDRREAARLRNREIGFVFQDSLLIPWLTVAENVALPLVYAEIAPRERDRRAREVLRSLGLDHRLDHKAGALSGGEAQRTAIARALINHPRLLLADEPTGNLDRENGRRIMEILDRLNADGVTVMLVTHDPDVASHSRQIITMVDGLVSQTSAPERPVGAAPPPGPPA